MLSMLLMGMLGLILLGDSIQRNERRELKRLQRTLSRLDS